MSTPHLRLHAQRSTASVCTRLCRSNTSSRAGLVNGPYRLQRQYRYQQLPLQKRFHSTETASTSSSHPHSSTVSQDEVSHFTKLASSWWDPHGPSRLLHLMNPLRHDFIRSCRQSISSSVDSDAGKKYTYLDVGCGGGIFATSAARLPSTQNVVAIDPTPSVIQVAQAKQRSDPGLAEPRLRYLNCAVEDLSQHTLGTSVATTQQDGHNPESRKEQYDVVTLFEVIEHVREPSSFLATALQHLKPGGWLIGSTIARHPLSYLTTKLIAEAPVVGIVPRGTHDWNQYINPSELRSWFEKENDEARLEGNAPRWSEQVQIQGVVYIPFVGWTWVNKSENYGNYFFGVQKLT